LGGVERSFGLGKKRLGFFLPGKGKRKKNVAKKMRKKERKMAGKGNE